MRSLVVTFGSFLLIFAAVRVIDAQACGRYYINVSVQNLDGKPVRNAKVRLSAITTDETKGAQFAADKADSSTFSVSFTEGHSFNEFHKVMVKAAGYKPAENQIKVLSCQGRHIVIRLARVGSKASAVWEFENRVSIEALGTDGKPLDNATLFISSGTSQPVEQKMEYGFADIDLPNGKYMFRINANGFLNKDIDVDLTPMANFYLKVQLRPEGVDP